MDVFTFLKLYKWYQIAQRITYVRELINLYYPWNHQKIIGYLMISEGNIS